MSKTFQFQIKDEVPLTTVKQIWERVRNELAQDLPATQAFDMPSIKAYVLPPKSFDKLNQQLLASSYIRDTGKTEWGEVTKPTDKLSAAAFRADGESQGFTWIIIKRDGFGNSLEYDLAHEITHIYEQTLLLPAGTLTRKTTPTIGSKLGKPLN